MAADRLRSIVAAISQSISSLQSPIGNLTGVALGLALSASVAAQVIPAARLGVLQAEDRRAPNSADLSRIQSQVRSANIQTAITALRALGRLERPNLIPSISPAIRNRYPEIRAEAANAAAQAAEGWRRGASAPGATAPGTLLTTLSARLEIEEEPSVRSALAQSIGRLPYRSAAEVGRAETALLELWARGTSSDDRLGFAKGLEALARLSGEIRPLSSEALAALGTLVRADTARDARIRRLALQAVVAAHAADIALITHAAADPDGQVRRIAIEAGLALPEALDLLISAVDDPAPLVRLQALYGLRAREDERICPMTIAMTADPDVRVALTAIDGLRACGGWSNAVSLLEDHATALARSDRYRQWHRTAHAILALASAAPDRARGRLDPLTRAHVWQIRLYAARAAAQMGEVDALKRLARDPDDNVVEAAVFGLHARVGHEADPTYLAALARNGSQAMRAAAVALEGSPHPDAEAALRAALDRVAGQPGMGPLEVRNAIVETLRSLGLTVRPPTPPRPEPNAGLTSENLSSLVAPRARITVREVGTFELALVVAEAPSTITRFIEMAESGYYEGTTFHGLVPDVAIHGGSPGANEFVGHPNLFRDEVGLWPHVRGSVGLASRGRDTGDGRFFINLVDNPRYDFQFTVFAQVLNGMDVVERLLEGDTIERIEILR